jgi:hypothetical protein
LKILNIPDYVSLVTDQHLLYFIAWLVTFYLGIIIFILINVIFTCILLYSILIIFRILGIPWLDGTTRGVFRRT